jgi:2-iminobutanoate/2-iminopropanoate deaminase
MTAIYGPYTPVRQVGNLYFVSGHVGINPETKTAAKDVSKQTHQVLKNMQNSLAVVGLKLNHVIKTTVYLTDMADFSAMNKVYETYFDAPRPARSTVAVKELPRVAGDARILVEIEAVASWERL